jgi:hypothetical protein
VKPLPCARTGGTRPCAGTGSTVDPNQAPYTRFVRLEKWQKNQIFKSVAAGGLDVKECVLDDNDAGGRVTHLPSASYFDFEGNPGHYTATTVVGEDHPGTVEFFGYVGIDEQVQRWARQVKVDVETPDLWADLEREREMLMGARYEQAENKPLSSEEQAELKGLLREVKDYAAKTYSLSAAQVLSLDARFGEVEAAAGRIGRKDLRLLLLGVMFEVIITDVLPRDSVRNILVLALTALDHLFGGGGSVPPMLLT